MRESSGQKNKSIASRTGRGVFFQLFGGGWQTLVRLASSTILARQLDAADFGLFGTALMVNELVFAITNVGIGTGIIAKNEVNEDDLCTCFWTMAGVRVLMFCLAFLSAPLAALYFHEPKVTDIVRVVSTNFLLSIPSSVSNALLNKDLRFKELVIIRSVGTLIESLLAVLLVLYANLGYWSLVYPMLFTTFLMEISICIVAGWIPKLRFSKTSFEYVYRFGINGLGISITNYLNQNIDFLLIGRILGTRQLGLYEFANRIPSLILLRFSRPVSAVAFPALSKMQDDDERLMSSFIKSVSYVALIALPALGGLAAVSGVLVPVFWGSKWNEIIVPMQIFCMCAALRSTVQSVNSVFFCKNRPDIPFKFSLALCPFTFLLTGILGYYYGMVGVAAGSLIATTPYFYLINKAFNMTNIRVYRFYAALAPSVFSTLLSMTVAYTVQLLLIEYALPTAIALLVSLFAGVIAYILSILILFKDVINDVVFTLKSVTSEN